MITKIYSKLRRFNLHQRSELFWRSLRNAGWSTGDYIVLPILWLIATPFFIQRLGIDQYGVWMLVNALIGFSGVFAFGLGDATIKYVSKYRALDDKQGVVRVVRSTLTIYTILGIITAVISYVAAPLLIINVFNVDLKNVPLAIASIQIGGVGIAVRFIDNVFISVFKGYERFDLSAKITAPTNIITILINILLVAMGFGIVQILLATIVIVGASTFVKYTIAKKLLLSNLRLLPTVNKKALEEIFSFGFYSWLQGLGGILLEQADKLLIASMLSTSALAYYTVCLQLSKQIHLLLARAGAFIFPLASAIKEQGNIEQLRRIYFKALNLTTIIAVGIALPLFLFAHNILTLWMGVDFANEASGILRVLAFVFALLATSIVPYYFMNGTGFVRLNTLFAIISGSVVALSMVFMIPLLGIIGAAWARTTNIPTGIIERSIIHYKVLNDRRWYAGISIILPVLTAFGTGLLLLILIGEAKVSIISLVCLISITVLLGSLIASVVCYIFNSANSLARSYEYGGEKYQDIQ